MLARPCPLTNKIVLLIFFSLTFPPGTLHHPSLKLIGHKGCSPVCLSLLLVQVPLSLLVVIHSREGVGECGAGQAAGAQVA